MLIKNINIIGEGAFYNYSSNKTIEVLSVLENVDWSNITDKNLEENSGFYAKLLDIVDDKLTNNSFPELFEDVERKSHLLLKVLRIRISISQYRLIFLRDDVEKKVIERVNVANELFEKTKVNLNSVVADAQDSIHLMSTNAEDRINNHLLTSEESFGEKLSKKVETVFDRIEPQLITTVLTLMGVFSAVITIIMSVVITSSSWLNNANGASAIIAFIVPNLVVVFSIVVLLEMVFSRKSAQIVVIPEKIGIVLN